MTTEQKNEIRKDLYKTGAVARFTHYRDGKLFYEMDVLGQVYRVGLSTYKNEFQYTGTNDFGDAMGNFVPLLASDMSGADFGIEMMAKHLWRWIDKAIDAGDWVSLREA